MLEIKLPRCLLVISERELLSLLRHDPALWKRALERGKGVQRARQAERRQKHDLPRAQ